MTTPERWSNIVYKYNAAQFATFVMFTRVAAILLSVKLKVKGKRHVHLI